MIDRLLKEVDGALSANLFTVALLCALTVPDIAGALDAEDGRANSERYARWFERWAAPLFAAGGEPILSGEDCYRYRCVLLHQGRASHPDGRYAQSIFLQSENVNVGNSGLLLAEDGQSLGIGVPQFCRTIVEAARNWLETVAESPLFQANNAETMRMFALSIKVEGHAGPART